MVQGLQSTQPYAQGGDGDSHLPGPASALGPDVISGLNTLKTHSSRFSLGQKGDDVLLNLEGLHHGSVPTERLPVLVEQNLERKSMSLSQRCQSEYLSFPRGRAWLVQVIFS